MPNYNLLSFPRDTLREDLRVIDPLSFTVMGYAELQGMILCARELAALVTASANMLQTDPGIEKHIVHFYAGAGVTHRILTEAGLVYEPRNRLHRTVSSTITEAALAAKRDSPDKSWFDCYSDVCGPAFDGATSLKPIISEATQDLDTHQQQQVRVGGGLVAMAVALEIQANLPS